MRLAHTGRGSARPYQQTYSFVLAKPAMCAPIETVVRRVVSTVSKKSVHGRMESIREFANPAGAENRTRAVRCPRRSNPRQYRFPAFGMVGSTAQNCGFHGESSQMRNSPARQSFTQAETPQMIHRTFFSLSQNENLVAHRQIITTSF